MDALIPFTTSGSLVDLVDSELNDGFPSMLRKDRGVMRPTFGSHYSQWGRLYSSLLVLPRRGEKVMVVLRDGRKLIGVFRSYDQFANFLLESTVERLHHQLEYADRDIGVLLIRGENVVALGEIDLIAEDNVPLRPVPLQEMEAKLSAETARRERDHAVRDKVLEAQGFVTEGREGDAY